MSNAKCNLHRLEWYFFFLKNDSKKRPCRCILNFNGLDKFILKTLQSRLKKEIESPDTTIYPREV